MCTQRGAENHMLPHGRMVRVQSSLFCDELKTDGFSTRTKPPNERQVDLNGAE